MQILTPLEHQQAAIRAITHVFDGVELTSEAQMEANPIFSPSDTQIATNISEIQNGMVDGIGAIPSPWRTRVQDDALGVDVKMETGTGKTLVYTQTMFELNRLYGFNKFVILVPSTAIKEGTRSFITSNSAKKYFSDTYGRRLNLVLDVLDPQRRKTKGRKSFPPAVANFVGGSRLSRGRISALLVNEGMLLSKATMAADYDQTVLGVSSVPYEAIQKTRPIVIIDEPHRFRRENRAYQTLLEEIKPQAILRFGATFPYLRKEKRTDYNNLIFNLGAVEAFNEQLVKGVSIQYPSAVEAETTRLRLTNISTRKPKQVTFQNLENRKSTTFSLNDSLATLDGDFAGVTVESIGRTDDPNISSGVTLSNGRILAKGDTLVAGVYSDTYQELMIRQALDNHFELEWENFQRPHRIKTLTLFFIDSVESYRGSQNDGHLRLRFEELLEQKLVREIKRFRSSRSGPARDYIAYLEASLADVKATNGGYFSIDNSTSDAAIQVEVDQILRDKQKLLSFTNSDGSPNTMRFVFSKWTLREGWDNPNVFQIVKLRSSGSEISKLQEVGRGLRLPVDDSGARLSSEQFYLTYLVDYTEEDFARSLVREINSDGKAAVTTVEKDLPRVAKQRGVTADALFLELWHVHGFIDRDYNIVPGKEEELMALFPEFNQGALQPDKVVEGKQKARVGIRREKFAELKQLWQELNSKYYLELDSLSNEEIDGCIDEILARDIFKAEVSRVSQDTVVAGTDGNLEVQTSTRQTYQVQASMPYGQWLKAVYERTYLPVARLHAGLVRANRKKKLTSDFFNTRTLDEFVAQFTVWMQREFFNRFSYRKVQGVLGATALTDAEGRALNSVIQGNVGVHRHETAKVPEKFLYDAFVYDAPKEMETIRDSTLDEIVVYGKIPRKSIQIPVYFGGTTSPDFMYVLKSSDGRTSVNFIVETKDVDKKSDLRESEKLRLKAAQKFFETMKGSDVRVKFSEQLRRDDIVILLQKMLESG